MRELVHVITDSMMTPSEADLEQVAKGVRSQRMNYAQDTGSANTLSVAFDPPIDSYTIGLPIRVKVAITNTGPSTINAGAGRVSIKRPTGAEVGAGDLPASGLIDLVYDGTNFQMINFGGAAAAGPPTVFQINIPYCVDTGTANTVIANFSPAITSYTAGLIFLVKISNTNTTFANINVNGLGLKAIWAQGNTTAYPLLPSDLVAGDVLIFTYDGTRFWIYANTILNQNVTFNVSNNAQISDLFFALGRKRLLAGTTVTVQMASGVYNPFTTVHPNADCITVKGTMLTSLPTLANFAHTGSSSAARAADSANNIAMLRSRYGTEVRVPNTHVGGGIYHIGGNPIKFENILVTGDNVYAGATRDVFQGLLGSMVCNGVSVWGMGSTAFMGYGGSNITCAECFVCSSYIGFYAAVASRIDLSGCGSFGNTTNGIIADRSSTVCFHTYDIQIGVPLHPPSQVQGNGNIGCLASLLGQIGLDKTIVTGNGLDLQATGMANIGKAGGTSTVGTTSPAIGVTGNGNSIINSDI
jgi:hypothetical protein